MAEVALEDLPNEQATFGRDLNKSAASTVADSPEADMAVLQLQEQETHVPDKQRARMVTQRVKARGASGDIGNKLLDRRRARRSDALFAAKNTAEPATAADVTTPSETQPAPEVMRRLGLVRRCIPTSQARDRQKAFRWPDEKCRAFLAHLLASAGSDEQVAQCVKTLVQRLINDKIEPEEFLDEMAKLKFAIPRPMAGYLADGLDLLRKSLYHRTTAIEGIRAPPFCSAYKLASACQILGHLCNSGN